jgi:hypothetical protein
VLELISIGVDGESWASAESESRGAWMVWSSAGEKCPLISCGFWGGPESEKEVDLLSRIFKKKKQRVKNRKVSWSPVVSTKDFAITKDPTPYCYWVYRIYVTSEKISQLK